MPERTLSSAFAFALGALPAAAASEVGAAVATSVSLYLSAFFEGLSGIVNVRLTLPPEHEKVSGRPGTGFEAESLQMLAPATMALRVAVPPERTVAVAAKPEITGLGVRA
jgi:hypothetical protein